MINKDKKEKLRAYKYAQERIIDLEEEMAEIIEKTQKTTTTLSDMPKAAKGKGMEDMIILHVDLIGKLKNEIIHCNKIKQQIEWWISTINDYQVERIMRLRYIKCLEWSEISQRVNYCERQVLRYHGDGLRFIEIEGCQ